MNVFFTADTHFGHGNIIKYSKRPFKDVLEMNETIIFNWNSRVGKNDIIYHLGDFCFGKTDSDFDVYIKRLNGLIVLIKGNHDKLAYRNKNKFYSFQNGYHEIKINEQDITLNHYAQTTWNKKHHGAFMLCGHSHYGMAATRKDGRWLGKILDVGVDGNNFMPYSFDEIENIMKDKPLMSTVPEFNDHHTH